MTFFSGIAFNLRGLWLGLRTPRLFFLGLLRFAVVAMLTAFLSGLILAYHEGILSLLWQQPQSLWIAWAWHLASWLLTLILMAVAALIAYLLSQIFFAVFIMDLMSRITERILTGKKETTPEVSMLAQMGFLIRQELPRNIIPVLLSLFIKVLAWFTPQGPILTIAGPMVAAIFLAWDNTDLVPARNLLPFRERFGMLCRNLSFHLGFGSLFLIPVFNLLLLSFAPVGATMYHLDRIKGATPPNQRNPMTTH